MCSSLVGRERNYVLKNSVGLSTDKKEEPSFSKKLKNNLRSDCFPYLNMVHYRRKNVLFFCFRIFFLIFTHQIVNERFLKLLF